MDRIQTYGKLSAATPNKYEKILNGTKRQVKNKKAIKKITNCTL